MDARAKPGPLCDRTLSVVGRDDGHERFVNGAAPWRLAQGTAQWRLFLFAASRGFRASLGLSSLAPRPSQCVASADNVRSRDFREGPTSPPASINRTACTRLT